MGSYRHGMWLDIDRKEFAAETGMVFRGLTVTAKDQEYLISIRATTRKGKRVVAFASGKSVRKAWRNWVAMASGRHGRHVWLRDFYAYNPRK